MPDVRARFDELKARAAEVWKAFNEPGKPRIFVTMSTCTIAMGANVILPKVRDEVGRRGLDVQIVEVSCNGLDWAEPLVDSQRPGEPRIVYGRVTPDLVPTLIEDVVVKGNPRPDLALGCYQEGGFGGVPYLYDDPWFKIQKRVLMARLGFTEPTNIDHYLATGGFEGLARAMSMNPDDVIAEVKKSNVRGRGGAAFPTGRKWEGARAAKGYPKYIICNTDEGIPGVWVDRMLIEGDPFAVLEGMITAAYAVGSEQGFQYIRAEYPLGAGRFAKAMEEARKVGLLGKNILGTDFSFDIQIRRGAGSYVAGESSALMSSIEGMRAMPRLKRPRSVERGLWGKPTSMNNTETFACVSQIMRHGADWWTSMGPPDTTGVKMESISGNIVRTGALEVVCGTPVSKIVEVAGGSTNGRPLKGVITDGPAGGIIPGHLLDSPLALDALWEIGVPMGAGGLVCFDDETCIVDLCRYCLVFNSEESCGRCATCRGGCQMFVVLLERSRRGDGERRDLDDAARLSWIMKTNSQCGLGQAAPIPVDSALLHFRAEWEAHVLEKRCPAGVCPVAPPARVGSRQ